MAPKAMKRPAAAASDPAPKKAKVDPALKAKVTAVEEALLSYDGLPESCLKLLAGSLKTTLYTMKEERHPLQINMVEMVAEALSNIQESYEKEIAGFQEKVDGADTEKVALTQGEVDAKAELEKLTAAAVEAKAAAAAASQETKAAKGALAEATAAQTTGDAEFTKFEEDKLKLESQLNDVLIPLKEKSASEAFAAEEKQKLKAFKKVCEQFDFETSMIEIAMAFMPKAPDTRGTFENMVTKQMEETFTQKITALAEKLAGLAPGKDERAALVATKQDELTAAEGKSTETGEALKIAQDKEAEAIALVAEKEKALKKFMPELKKAGNGLDKAKAALEEFKTGAYQSFNELKELAPPPPEPEPVPDETAAADPEPETAPMEEEAAAPAEVAAPAEAAPAEEAPAEAAPAAEA